MSDEKPAYLPSAALAKAQGDLEWLDRHGVLTGIAAVVAERRAQIERGDDTSGQYAAEGAIDFGEWAKGGALCAAVLDEPD